VLKQACEYETPLYRIAGGSDEFAEVQTVAITHGFTGCEALRQGVQTLVVEHYAAQRRPRLPMERVVDKSTALLQTQNEINRLLDLLS
jgi:hypothetical protein